MRSLQWRILYIFSTKKIKLKDSDEASTDSGSDNEDLWGAQVSRRISRTTIGKKKLKQFYRCQNESSLMRINNVVGSTIADLDTPRVAYFWCSAQSYDVNGQSFKRSSAGTNVYATWSINPQSETWYDAQPGIPHHVEPNALSSKQQRCTESIQREYVGKVQEPPFDTKTSQKRNAHAKNGSGALRAVEDQDNDCHTKTWV